jgi:hypothetical protein
MVDQMAEIPRRGIMPFPQASFPRAPAANGRVCILPIYDRNRQEFRFE